MVLVARCNFNKRQLIENMLEMRWTMQYIWQYRNLLAHSLVVMLQDLLYGEFLIYDGIWFATPYSCSWFTWEVDWHVQPQICVGARALFWFIWHCRNNVTFDKQKLDSYLQVIFKALDTVLEHRRRATVTHRSPWLWRLSSNIGYCLLRCLALNSNHLLCFALWSRLDLQ